MFSVNNNFSFAVHGAANAHNKGFAYQLGHYLKNLENLLAKDAGEIFTTIFPGISNMANIHPLFVHFPIAFISAFFLIDLLGSLFRNNDWRRTASWFLYLGAISAVLTAAAGFQAAATVAHNDTVHHIMMHHKTYGISIVSLTVLLSAWRLIVKGYFGFMANILHLGLALLTCIIISLGMDLGGLMVYKYGVGVSAVPQAANEHHHSSHMHNH